MYKRIIATKAFARSWKRLPKPIQHLVNEKINLLAQNQAHPSLKVHRVSRQRGKDVWICYIGVSMRLLYQRRNDAIYLQEVGAHGVIDNVHQRHFG